MQPILRPPESEQLEYEGEICLVIGKTGRRIPKDRAFEWVAGITMCNEGTIRDWIRHGRFNVTQGKAWDCDRQHGPVDDHRRRSRKSRCTSPARSTAR